MPVAGTEGRFGGEGGMMNTKLRVLGAALIALAAVGLTACGTPPPSGGGGGSSLVGCYPSVFGTSVRITQDGSQLWWQAYLGSGCGGGTSGSPEKIYPGPPSASADLLCQTFTGQPDATSTDQLARLLVPAQNFYSCNYLL